MSDSADSADKAATAVRAGDIIFQSPQVVADSMNLAATRYIPQDAEESFIAAFSAEPGQLNQPGRPGAEALLVLQTDQDANDEGEGPGIVAVQLGLMSTEAVANHLPHLADKLTKPKVFFIGGHREPVVLAVALLTPEPAASDNPAAAASQAPQPSHPSRFGPDNRFLLIHTGEGAPSVEDQVAAATGSSDGSRLQGMRLFHSYVSVSHAQVNKWVECGLVGVEHATPDDVFTAKPAETWRQLMKRRPFPENLFVTWATNPERN
ncbi:hypothetical protein [Corynebacterium falsenii]|uniref:hypothetical protein n=1 Tax=Corynebacterium falsenii TaxID=108486 RepID=UPI001D38C164|nr:hypothetical protein [Corynebacterium falsenii]HJF12825.1 hypothetical protein [Corynebacterium falsenii]